MNAPSPTEEKIVKKTASSPPRILVVEDDPVTACLFQNLLTTAGFEVAVAADGEECLARAESWSPAIIILDLLLPKLHGIDVLRRLKNSPETRGIGVIMCTARSYKADVQQALSLGAFAVLAKPVERAELIATVQRFLRHEKPPLDRTLLATPPAAPGEIYAPVLPKDRPFIRFWGTRGSIPVSGPGYIRHGGDTSCVEVGRGAESIIIDAGSGIRELGLKLARGGPRRVHLFITHTHWDHIQGFPFFAPLFIPGFEVVVYGASGFGKDLKSIFQGQVDRDYFPVQFEDMRAKVEFVVLTPEPVAVGNLSVTWEYTQHPQATIGYKVEVAGRKVGYASDDEFLIGYHGSPLAITAESEWLVPHRRLVEFLTDVDLLVHEAQYTNLEYGAKVRWGHSSVSNACVLARLARARRWLVTHHDPLHEDTFLDEKLNVTREILRTLEHPVELGNCFDGMVEYF